MKAEKNLRFFGLDLSGLVGNARLGVEHILYDQQSWLLRRFMPNITAFHEGGWWSVNELGKLSSPLESMGECVESASFLALCLPFNEVLFKVISLPESSERYLADAVKIEVESYTPFPIEDTVYDWRVVQRRQGELTVNIAMLSKARADNIRADMQASLPDVAVDGTELWAVDEERERETVPIRMRSDDSRKRTYLERLRSLGLWSGIAIGLAIASLIVPASSSAFRARMLTQENAALVDQAEWADAAKRALALQRSQLNLIRDATQARPNYGAVLEQIASVTPDGTYLEVLSLSNGQAEIRGYSDNAAALLRSLTEQPGFVSVNANSAFVRDQRSGLERFSIAWQLPE